MGTARGKVRWKLGAGGGRGEKPRDGRAKVASVAGRRYVSMAEKGEGENETMTLTVAFRGSNLR